MSKPGILDLITRLGVINDGKDDKETLKLINKIIWAASNKKRSDWPDKELRSMYNQMDEVQKDWFLQTMIDMSVALEEYYN